MARMRARFGEPSDGLPPVSGTAAGCTGEADAATLALAETEAEAVVVGVAVALAVGVGVSDAVGVGVSPASAGGAPDAKPTTMNAPTIRTSPAISTFILFSFPLYKLSTAAIVQNEPAPDLSRALCNKTIARNALSAPQVTKTVLKLGFPGSNSVSASRRDAGQVRTTRMCARFVGHCTRPKPLRAQWSESWFPINW